jgi:hypothetical protein
MRKSKTIQLRGFPNDVTADDVKRLVEHYTGEGSVFAMKIRESKGRDKKSFAVIQFTTYCRTCYRYDGLTLTYQTFVNIAVWELRFQSFGNGKRYRSKAKGVFGLFG